MFEEWRYYPYVATSDVECLFDRERDLSSENTEKMEWITEHLPVSASVCSNVSGFTSHECFVVERDEEMESGV